jgi:hypothetical protein
MIGFDHGMIQWIRMVEKPSGFFPFYLVDPVTPDSNLRRVMTSCWLAQDPIPAS